MNSGFLNTWKHPNLDTRYVVIENIPTRKYLNRQTDWSRPQTQE